jgi:branched-chain amino acid transport system ATP-binding protein
VLKLNNLSSGYGVSKAVDAVSLEVPSDEVVAVVGSNGAGKTTLLRTVMGLNKAWSGSVELDGRRIDQLTTHRRVQLGMVLVPEGRHLFMGLSVAKNIRLGAYRRNDRGQIGADQEWVYHLFPALRERRGNIAGNLSGGEQQMCAIGRALMSRPTLLMIDEMSAGLSPVVVEQLMDTLMTIRKQRGMSLLVVEQDVGVALAIADRGYVLVEGRLAMSGSAKDLADHPNVKASYLGM